MVGHHILSVQHLVEGPCASERNVSFNDDVKACFCASGGGKTSCSYNYIIVTLSSSSLSHGSIHIITESDAENSQIVSDPTCRNCSSRSKSGSIHRGSFHAQDFFGAERVCREFDWMDDSVSLLNSNQEDDSIVMKKTHHGETCMLMVASPLAPFFDIPSSAALHDQVDSKCHCVIL